jgi:uncharacterized protein YbbK (DUF523 family)
MTDQNYLNSLRTPTPQDPLRILMSACLCGVTCGYDGTANGTYPSALKVLDYPTASVCRFCPEEFSFGSPREMCDIHGGDGFDVLKGTAKVLSDSGKDWTAGMIKGAESMLHEAQKHQIELAVMMDVSGACGSQVIYEGNRFDAQPTYQIGMGVAAALLTQHGFKVISQRDYASLEILYRKLDPTHVVDQSALDHHEIEWYKNYFKIN